MTRTADFADGLTTDCKVCFYVMTKYIRLCQHHRIKNKGNNPEKELGLCVFPKMFPKFVEHTNYGSVSLFSMLNLENVILFIFRLLYINKIIITTPCKRNRIETRSVF